MELGLELGHGAEISQVVGFGTSYFEHNSIFSGSIISCHKSIIDSVRMSTQNSTEIDCRKPHPLFYWMASGL